MTAEVPALTAAQMRDVDRLMVDVYGIHPLQMMELAGRNLAALARLHLGSVADRRILVAAGKGNNGGGGLVAARHLANWGARVMVAVESAASLSGVPAVQWRTLDDLPVSRIEGTAAPGALVRQDPALVLDALIGYSLSGNPRGWAAVMIGQINALGSPVLALDLPSGLDATTGRPGTPCVRATATMTLALPKVGLLAEGAKPYVGALYLADIGVPPGLYARLGLHVGPLFEETELIKLT